MPTIQETVDRITGAPDFDSRVALIRLIPQYHGIGEHQAIYAMLAKKVYVPYLVPDFAFIHHERFYEPNYFEEIYDKVYSATDGFLKTSVEDLEMVISQDSRSLLIFRTILGFTREEFAHAAQLVNASLELEQLNVGKINSMERSGTRPSPSQAHVAAVTIDKTLKKILFGLPPNNLYSKQDKPDTVNGWSSVRHFSNHGVPFSTFLHQRHYGGSFRQVLDATSTLRGNLLEESVESLFLSNKILYLRTGCNNQSEILRQFEIRVTPAPDFIVHDSHGNLRAMLECKTINDGGTARDKAPRFYRLHQECVRLGGVPLFAVLGGMGWARVNDALGPVIRDTEGRVFTLTNLSTMMHVSPFSILCMDKSLI